MCTMMDKAEAYILLSYWEFAIQHTVHIYNQSLMKQLNWHTLYKLLLSKILDNLHLRVFSCGAYVHIPLDVHKQTCSEIWTNDI